MRCFLAVKPSEEICREFYTFNKFFENILKSKIVKPENMHITLSFLGEQNNANISEICNIMESIDFNGCDIRYTGIDFYGSLTYPKVLFVKGVSDELITIQNRLKDMLQAKEIAFDRKLFNIHLTLQRIKKVISPGIFKRTLSEVNQGFEDKKDYVKSIYLIKSTLTSTGAKYDIVYEKKLNKGVKHG